MGNTGSVVRMGGSRSGAWAPKLKSTYDGLKPRVSSSSSKIIKGSSHKLTKAVSKAASEASNSAGRAVARGASKTAAKQASRRAAIGMGGRASTKLLGSVASVAMAGEAGWTAGKAIKRSVRGRNDKKIASQEERQNALGRRRASINAKKRAGKF